jgi:predicted hydrocarbon binding protein
MVRMVSARVFGTSECTGMPSIDCPACDVSSYVEEERLTRVCTRCDGTGVVFIEEDTHDAVIHS